METYSYSAKDKQGRRVYGTLQARDEADLQARLKQEEKYLLSAAVQGEKHEHKRMRADRVADFSRNIGKLLGAGVSLVKALRIVCEDETLGKWERSVLAEVLMQVCQGFSLSEAMEQQGDVFPPMLISMYRCAETAGTLGDTASRMAGYYDREYRLNQKIKNAMIYPKILMVLMVGVVLVIMGYVVPQFRVLFSQMEVLPLSTRLLLGLSNFVKNHLVGILICCILLWIIWKLVMSISVVRYQVDRMKVHIPVTGRLMQVIYTARFARTLASMYNAGISILTCLDIARDTISNAYIEKQFDQVISDVCAGKNLSEALENVDGFTKKLVSSVVVGEETGALDTMLVAAADQLEYDGEMAVDRLVSMVEPVMIVVMAVVVGFMMISIIQPIYGSYEVIANTRR
jgi:type IV pilus assembly protein PilC